MKKVFLFAPLIFISILLLLIGIALIKQDNLFQKNIVKSVKPADHFTCNLDKEVDKDILNYLTG